MSPGCRRSPRCRLLARRRRGARLPARAARRGRRGEEDVEAAGTSSLDELLDAIGVDAARWYLVSRGHDQTIELDVDLAAERSQKNPVYYVQYAHARVAGIFRSVAERTGFPPDEKGSMGVLEPELRLDNTPTVALEPEERELVKRLLDFPQVVREATERRAVHAIPI